MIPLMRNTFFHERERRALLADFVLSGERLSMGTQCLRFERSFAEYQGRREAVLFNSGGSANLALIQSLRNLRWLAVGDRVGVSALTWSTNVMPIIQMGLVPVALDCCPETLNTMTADVPAGLQSVFLTNALGFTGDLPRIARLCTELGSLLLEDNCEALGTALPEGRAGNFGLASTFSFFVGHHMSTVEGGMVCTDDDSLAEMLRVVRANGWDRNLTAKQQRSWRDAANVAGEWEAKYTFYDLGFNLRPTELVGVLGQAQLRSLPEAVALRGEHFAKLEETARGNDDLVTLNHLHISTLSPFAFPVLCKTPELRNRYVDQFTGAGVEIRPMIAGNIQRQPFYRKHVVGTRDTPGADFVHRCGFYCGLYPDMDSQDLETITSCLLKR